MNYWISKPKKRCRLKLHLFFYLIDAQIKTLTSTSDSARVANAARNRFVLSCHSFWRASKINCARPQELRFVRDSALLLIGFWRGFRGDELRRFQVEDVTVSPGEGMSGYLSRTKSDRQYHGSSFKTPALSRLCPVSAFVEWTSLAL